MSLCASPHTLPKNSTASQTASRLWLGSPMPIRTIFLTSLRTRLASQYCADDLGARELAHEAALARHAEGRTRAAQPT
ncbi:MAG: hypothetical protein ACLUNV_05265 [Sutterella wadsworthensis]